MITIITMIYILAKVVSTHGKIDKNMKQVRTNNRCRVGNTLMMGWRKVRPLWILPALVCSGCYFNSAGHIFRKASYDAQINTHSLQDFLYYDGKDYYAEFYQYRVGEKVITQYSALKKGQKKEYEYIPSGCVLCRLPHDLASYLITGRGNSELMKLDLVEKNAQELKDKCTRIPITRKPKKAVLLYKYKSPNAFWYYLAGSFDWLCVDLPITCLENSLAIVLVPTGALLEGFAKGLQTPQSNLPNGIQNTAPQMPTVGSGIMPTNMQTPANLQMPMISPDTWLSPDPNTGMLTSPALERQKKYMDIYFEYEQRKLDNFNPKY